MRNLTRKQRCAMLALEHALDRDPDHRIDASDRIDLTRRLPAVSPRRRYDLPAPAGSPDPTGFGEGCVL